MAQQDQFDVVIVGSGAGGAPVAHTLVGGGKSVLILEKGPLVPPATRRSLRSQRLQARRADLRRSGEDPHRAGPRQHRCVVLHEPRRAGPQRRAARLPQRQQRRLRDDRGLHLPVRRRRHAALRRRVASLQPARLDAPDLQSGRTLAHDPGGDVEREARDWPITYDELEPYYTKAEELIGFNGTRQNQIKPLGATSRDFYQTPLPPNPISEYARVGMEALGMKPYRTPLAVITEDHAPSGRTVGRSASRDGTAARRPPTSTATATRSTTSRARGCRCSGRSPGTHSSRSVRTASSRTSSRAAAVSSPCTTAIRAASRPRSPARWSSWRARRSRRCGC